MFFQLQDILEFLADVHTLSKVKSNVKGLTVGLNEDTLGGILKASLAQYVALEITRGNGKDNRSANRFLPWLFNPPANTAAQVKGCTFMLRDSLVLHTIVPLIDLNNVK